MKGLQFAKDVLIVIAALLFCAVFFAVFYIVYPIWWCYQEIKLKTQKRKENATN